MTAATSAAAISNELFVLNEEVVILGSFVIFLGYVSTLVREPYREWADGQIQVNSSSSRINSLLSKADHIVFVRVYRKSRISSVPLVPLTLLLFKSESIPLER